MPLTQQQILDALVYARQAPNDGVRWNFPHVAGNVLTAGAGLGTPVALSYSMLDSLPAYYTPGNPDVIYPSDFSALTAVEQTAVQAAMGAIAEVAGVSFTAATSGVGQIAFGAFSVGFPTGAAGFAYAPSWAYSYSTDLASNVTTITSATESSAGGDVWLNSENFAAASASVFAPNGSGYMTLLHELGHALGLKHPFEGSAPYLMPDAYDNRGVTLMSYTDAANTLAVDVSGDASSYSWMSYNLVPRTLMPADMLALQYLYGANTSTRSTDTSYSWQASERFFETLWDGGGSDTLDCANQVLPCVIDLTPGSYSSVGIRSAGQLRMDLPAFATQAPTPTYDGRNNLAIAYGVTIETAFGGSAADIMTGNAAANRLVGNDGDDSLAGGDGNDTLDGGAGADTIDGGAGIDELVLDGPFAAFTLDRQTDGFLHVVYLGQTVDLVSNVESVRFGDGTVVDVTQDGGPATGSEIADIAGAVASGFAIAIPDTAFVVQNAGDTLSYAVSLGDGSPLPAWMSFAAERRTVDCLPTPADVGTWTLRVTATDPAGGTAFQDVAVTVQVVPPTLGPVAVRAFGNATLNMGSVVQYYVAINPPVMNATTIRIVMADRTVQEYSGTFTYETSNGVTQLVGGTLNGLTQYAADGVTPIYAFTGLSLSMTTYLDYARNGAGEALKALALAGNDLIEGGGAADTLIGYAGTDSMAGGAGNDTYVVDNLGDMAVEAVGGGTDTVRATVSYGLADNLENLRLEGVALYGTGNGLNNSIVGNAAANVLDGRGGADTLAGGAGNDSYTIDVANDIVVEAAGAGTDTVFAAVGYTLAANVERLTLTGSGATQGIGNGLANTLTGNEGANDLRGLDGADALLGGAGADTLYGGAGNDTLDGGSGADSLVGGAGNDVYDVASLADIISEDLAGGIDTVRTALTVTLAANVENLLLQDGGTAGSGNGGANLLTGNGGANALAGGAGNDTLQGAGGDDSLGGEGGSDRLEGGAGNDSLDGGDGGDVLLGGAGDDRYRVDLLRNALGAIVLQDMVSEATGQGSDTVVVRNGLNLSFPAATLTLGLNLEGLDLAETASLVLNLTGNALDNTLTGNEATNRLDGGLGADTLAGGSGNDTYWVGQSGDLIVEAADGGTDTALVGIATAGTSWTLADNLENATLSSLVAGSLVGNGLDNALTGNNAVNTLSGGDGNDSLDGRGGADSLVGGLGDDSYAIDLRGDVIVEAAAGGTDSVLVGITLAGAAWTLVDNLENATLAATAVVGVVGNGLDNTLTGNAAANSLVGGDGNDSLMGLGGNDSLNGGAGDDSLSGGLGNDSFVVDSVGDNVTDSGGIDTVQSAIDYALGDNIENLSLTGSAVSATGNALANQLVGNAADNILDGGLGRDTLAGGAGNDRYTVDLALSGTLVGVEDAVSEGFNQGNDTVLLRNGNGLTLAGSYTVSAVANIENLDVSATGTLLLNAMGNALDNVLTGNAAANRLDGGSGADTLVGGGGNDTYLVAQSGDRIVEAADGGTDTALVGIATAGASWALADNLENATLSSSLVAGSLVGNGLDNALTGNNAANTLTGGDGNDSLDGRGGADSLVGGAGNDSYVIDLRGDAIVEAAAGGTDSVLVGITLAGAAWTLVDNLENATLAATAVVGLIGNGLDNTLTGNAAANSLVGGDGNDSLMGLGGNDTLNGGAGDDSLSGGLGNDSFVVDSAGDSVTDSGGSDTVLSAMDYALGDDIEHLSLTGSAVGATGNGLANRLSGNAADNILDGGLGRDTLAGGAGNDRYTVDLAQSGTLVSLEDTVSESLGQGSDTLVLRNRNGLTLAGTYTVTAMANVENIDLTATGTLLLNATGNALNNILTGNAAANVLRGGTGNDGYVAGLGDTVNEWAGTVAGGIDELQLKVGRLGDAITSLSFADLSFLQTNGHRDLVIGIAGQGSVTVAGMNAAATLVETLRLFDADGNDLYGAISLRPTFNAVATATTATALTLGSTTDAYGLLAA